MPNNHPIPDAERLALNAVRQLAFGLDVEIELQACTHLLHPGAMLMPLHIETPYVEPRALSERSGRAIWLKFESAQPSGSFKLRGIGHVCETYFARCCHLVRRKMGL